MGLLSLATGQCQGQAARGARPRPRKEIRGLCGAQPTRWIPLGFPLRPPCLTPCPSHTAGASHLPSLTAAVSLAHGGERRIKPGAWKTFGRAPGIIPPALSGWQGELEGSVWEQSVARPCVPGAPAGPWGWLEPGEIHGPEPCTGRATVRTPGLSPFPGSWDVPPPPWALCPQPWAWRREELRGHCWQPQTGSVCAGPQQGTEPH